MPAGVETEAADSPGRSLHRQAMQLYRRAALKMDASSVN